MWSKNNNVKSVALLMVVVLLLCSTVTPSLAAGRPSSLFRPLSDILTYDDSGLSASCQPKGAFCAVYACCKDLFCISYFDFKSSSFYNVCW
ncbi:hypothetical protein RND81_09G108000 [Saponaria officinalis]|uniref:Uncharacterized protein n=1 Tax=Saponaria officinalis TaxID=3572 RepID=A0AAW1IL33_SAPOF